MSTLSIIIIVIFVGIIAIVIVALSGTGKKKLKQVHHEPVPKILDRHHTNPILQPKQDFDWETEAVFNPAAITDPKGHVHILYRAVGKDGLSRLGYDSSDDGVHFNKKRLPYPVFVVNHQSSAADQVEAARRAGQPPLPDHAKRYDAAVYASGGSWGGCEDPRMVQIGDQIYLTYTVFNDWSSIRMGVSHISAKNFFERKWNWSRPLLISPGNETNKNWVLFPEKIRGKFAILHRISPNIQIDYVDRLEDLASGAVIIKDKKLPPTMGWASKKFGTGKVAAKPGWDKWVRGAGPPPMKTDRGWLLLYHAMSATETHRYKIGAMLLDYKDPSKVLARTKHPILSPDEWYENDSKPGVVYASGAFIRDNTLYVYYGAGDKHIGLATAPMGKIWSQMLPIKQ